MENYIERYWRNKIKSYKNIPLPFQRLSKHVEEQSKIERKIPIDTVEYLNRVSKGNEDAKIILLYSIFGYLLSRYLEVEDDIHILTYSPSGNEIILNIVYEENMTYEQLVNVVKKEVVKSYKFSNFNLLDIDTSSLINNYSISFNISPANKGISSYVKKDMSFFIDLSENVIAVTYDSGKYYQVVIDSIVNSFISTINIFLNSPNILIKDICIISEEEKNKLIYNCNETYVEFDEEKLMHELFMDQSIKTPNNIAVSDGISKITYEELNINSNRISRLIKSNTKQASCQYVPVIMDRSISMIASLLGILKAGCAYIPLEPDLPDQRFVEILDQVKPEILFTDNKQIGRFIELNKNICSVKTIICPDLINITSLIDSHITVFGKQDIVQQECLYVRTVNSDNHAYIIFTSGTTGAPKGVVIKHRSVINLIEWVNNTFGICETDRNIFVTSISFDLSVYDIFGILAAGGSIRIAAKEEMKEPSVIFNIIQNEKITYWNSAPAYMQSILNGFNSDITIKNNSLRLIFLSGDWIPLLMPDILRSIFVKSKIISLGGATEATIWSNYFQVENIALEWKSIPYGVPIQNCKYYVLDDKMQPLPIGIKGNLFIGGKCLAEGYYNEDILTKEKFLENPFCPNEKIYNTGDQARWFFDFNIEFLGRKDNQVKLRGYRIELGEVENKIIKLFDLKDVICLLVKDKNENSYLCTFICTKDENINFTHMRDRLKQHLPEYMVPQYILKMDNFPITSNGKLDRKKMAAEWEVLKNEQNTNLIVNPVNEIEEKLVDIFKNTLKIEQVSTTDNFFDAGGTSLLLIEINKRINDSFNMDMSIIEQFKHTTIRDLSNYISSRNFSYGNDLLIVDEVGDEELNNTIDLLKNIDRYE